MTSTTNDPNAINLDDFELDHLGKSPTTTSESVLDSEKLETEADPFGELSFAELMTINDTVNPVTQSQLQTQSIEEASATPENLHTPVGSLDDINISKEAEIDTKPTMPTADTPNINQMDTDLDFDFEEPLKNSEANTSNVPIITAPHDDNEIAPTSTTKNNNDPWFHEENLPKDTTLNHPLSDFATPAAVAGVASTALLANQTNPSSSPLNSSTITTPTPFTNSTNSVPSPNLTTPSIQNSSNVDLTQPQTTTPSVKPKAKGKALFGKKEKLLSTPISTTPPVGSMVKQPAAKKNNHLLLGLLGAIAALGVGYWFFNQSEPTSAPAPVAQKTTPIPAVSATPTTPTSATITTATSVPASTITNSSVATTTQTTTMASSSTADSVTLNKAVTIKPEEITAVPLPADNVTAKEEIDRLGQQSQQLEQQEKMMKEQLKMMNELSSKKEERIAILEKQIAEIEAQKKQAKQ